MNTMFPRIRIVATAIALCAASGELVAADEVTETIDEALQAYAQQDYQGAAQALDMAAQLVRQKRAQGLATYLPAAPSGWTAEEVDASAAGATLYGGMVSAGRRYSKGDSSVNVQFITDSPMLQGVLMMFNMPMMASADGGKIERIKGQRAIVKYKAADRDGSIQIVVGGTMLVQIEGNDVTDVELKAFAEAIDYARLNESL